MTRRVASVALICALALPLCGRASAISTFEDTLPGPPVSRVPSTWPPNNAAHRFLPAGTDSAPRDSGPGPDESPVAISASSAPWAVAIGESQNLQDDFICGGVVVDRSWVLTAAHCMFSVAARWPNDTQPFVFTDTASLASPGRKLAVREIVMHPRYDARTLLNDLALIRVDTENESNIVPLRTDGPPIEEQVGDIGTIIGWGATTAAQGVHHSENLQLVQTAIIDNSVCFSAANFAALSKDGVFCGKSLLKYHDICFRFGGSPVVLYDKNSNLYLAGMVTWNTPCPIQSRSVGVYLDVQFHLPWIKSVVRGTAGP